MSFIIVILHMAVLNPMYCTVTYCHHRQILFLSFISSFVLNTIYLLIALTHSTVTILYSDSIIFGKLVVVGMFVMLELHVLHFYALFTCNFSPSFNHFDSCCCHHHYHIHCYCCIRVTSIVVIIVFSIGKKALFIIAAHEL